MAADTHRGWDLYVRDRLADTLEIITVAVDGEAAGGGALGMAISDNGRYVAFSSRAGNIVRGDENRTTDVFVRDRWRDSTQRVSVASGGREANGPSFNPSLFADGRRVSFTSNATNLAHGDTNGEVDVFVHDRLSRVTTLASVSSSGQPGNSYSGTAELSPNGSHVAFVSNATNLSRSDTNDVRDVFVRNLSTQETRRLSIGNSEQQANDYSDDPSLSANGRFVVFQSGADNLVPRDESPFTDVFVRDRAAHTTRLVSVDSRGRQDFSLSTSPSISASGRFIAFDSSAQLVPSPPTVFQDVYVRDLLAGTTQLVTVPTMGEFTECCSGEPEISADGHHVVFYSSSRKIVTGESDSVERDVFVRDQREDARWLVP